MKIGSTLKSPKIRKLRGSECTIWSLGSSKSKLNAFLRFNSFNHSAGISSHESGKTYQIKHRRFQQLNNGDRSRVRDDGFLGENNFSLFESWMIWYLHLIFMLFLMFSRTQSKYSSFMWGNTDLRY